MIVVTSIELSHGARRCQKEPESRVDCAAENSHMGARQDLARTGEKMKSEEKCSRRRRMDQFSGWIAGGIGVLLLAGVTAVRVKPVQADDDHQFYKQLNLVSDLPNEAIRL